MPSKRIPCPRCTNTTLRLFQLPGGGEGCAACLGNKPEPQVVQTSLAEVECNALLNLTHPMAMTRVRAELNAAAERSRQKAETMAEAYGRPDRAKVLRLQELARILEQDARDLYFLTRHEPENLDRIRRKLAHVEGLTSALRGELEGA